jgi:acyl-coenzyme A thioesterase 13
MSSTSNDSEDYLPTPLPLEEAAKIPGNCSPELKQRMAYMTLMMSRSSENFGTSISRNLKLTDVSVNEKAEDPAKLEARVVCEMDVQKGIFICHHFFATLT